jgi:hypothetical protein
VEWFGCCEGGGLGARPPRPRRPLSFALGEGKSERARARGARALRRRFSRAGGSRAATVSLLLFPAGCLAGRGGRGRRCANERNQTKKREGVSCSGFSLSLSLARGLSSLRSCSCLCPASESGENASACQGLRGGRGGEGAAHGFFLSAEERFLSVALSLSLSLSFPRLGEVLSRSRRNRPPQKFTAARLVSTRVSPGRGNMSKGGGEGTRRAGRRERGALLSRSSRDDACDTHLLCFACPAVSRTSWGARGAGTFEGG